MGISSCKKRMWLLWSAYIKQKKQCSTTLTVVGWNDSMAVYVYSSEYSKPKRFVSAFEKGWKKVYSKTIIKLILLLHSEHDFYQQNGPESGQAQHWYPNEKMVVIPVFSNGLCFYSEVLGSLLFLAFQRDIDNAIFLKYSKEGRSPSGHWEIWNVPIDL